RVSVPEELRGSGGDKSNRRNRADIISADIVFAAHVEAAIGRNLFAAKSRDVCQLRVQTQHVASLVDPFEAFEFEYVGDRVDVSADRTASECQRIEIAFTFRRLLRIVDVVVLHSRSDRTGHDAIQRARSGEAAALNGCKEQLRGVVKGLDVGPRES